MFQSIQKLIKQTAKDLNLDPAITEKVVMSQWKFVVSNFANPKYPVIRLEDLGKFIVSPTSVRIYFKKARAGLRSSPDSVRFNKEVKDIASMRYPSQAYHLSRQFKKRFGSWHYKSALPINNNVE